MKKILLIGDSIRWQYFPRVKEAFKEVAMVYTNDDSARYSVHTLRYLDEWKRVGNIPDDIDIVHWNVGAWDILHMYGDKDPLTSLMEYKHNIERIDKALRKIYPKAQLVFAPITAIKDHRFTEPEYYYRLNSDAQAYNAVALEVLKDTDTIINDLYALTKDLSDEYYADGVHFSEEIGVPYISQAVIKKLCEVGKIEVSKIKNIESVTTEKQDTSVFGR